MLIAPRREHMRSGIPLDQVLSLDRPVVEATVHQDSHGVFRLKDHNPLMQDAEGVCDPGKHLPGDGLDDALIEVPAKLPQTFVTINTLPRGGAHGFKVHWISLTNMPV